jgi:hypothetical protein
LPKPPLQHCDSSRAGPITESIRCHATSDKEALVLRTRTSAASRDADRDDLSSAEPPPNEFQLGETADHPRVAAYREPAQLRCRALATWTPRTAFVMGDLLGGARWDRTRAVLRPPQASPKINRVPGLKVYRSPPPGVYSHVLPAVGAAWAAPTAPRRQVFNDKSIDGQSTMDDPQ